MEETLKQILRRLEVIEENQAKLITRIENIEDWQDTNAHIDDSWQDLIKNNFSVVSAEHSVIIKALEALLPVDFADCDDCDECGVSTRKVRVRVKKSADSEK